MPPSVFKGVDLQASSNNREHRTSEISTEKLIVRRGQAFNVTLNLKDAFNPNVHPLHFTAATGKHPSEDRGTLSNFSVPDRVRRSPSAKAVWKVELQRNLSLSNNSINLAITPPADAPVGRYKLEVKHRDELKELGTLVVLFNPWCKDDWVFLPDEAERQEYVMNEHGIVYQGSGNYIGSTHWDFGQFEDDMVDICLKILDVNRKHRLDPADDVSARCNPIYVGRVISDMTNFMGENGILIGNWSNDYSGGTSPTAWAGSYPILKKWFRTGPVKFGQCWVFASVMCSVMRLLGIPCRVVTNFQSAHDTNKNLIIETYLGPGAESSGDSVWNFHVWTECWMRRPDLSEDRKYDGWQVLDPTPQEESGGVFRCGPASVKAILNGETALKYDVPFVFAEVNADCEDWLVKSSGEKIKLYSDPKRVGKNISTKAVGSNKRSDITSNYKYKEGSKKERKVFNYARTRDYSREDELEENPFMNYSSTTTSTSFPRTVTPPTTSYSACCIMPSEIVELEEDTSLPPPPVTLQFKEASKPINGQDVNMHLLVKNNSTDLKKLSIDIKVLAKKYHGVVTGQIQTEQKVETVQPGKEVTIPVVIKYSVYRKFILENENIKVTAIITDQQKADEPYLAVNDIVLFNPSIQVVASREVKSNQQASGEVIFMNPLNETLTDCTISLSGSGIWRESMEFRLSELRPNNRLCVQFFFAAYKTGQKTVIATFSCSAFKNIKGSCSITVKA